MKEISSEKLTTQKEKAYLSKWRILLLVLGGLVVGVISGLFGGGGGTVVIPLLVSVGLLREKSAHATSIALILPLALVSGIMYFAMGERPDYHISVMTVMGVFIGGLIGTFFLAKIKTDVLKIIFYIIMIVAGIKMIVG